MSKKIGQSSVKNTGAWQSDTVNQPIGVSNEDSRTVLKLADIVKSPNIATMLKEQELSDIGKWVVDNYDIDRTTRTDWEQRNEEGIKLALQVVEVKSFPWTNCSNVKFPLLTIAALQFLARISILTKGRNLVKMEVVGADPDGKKYQQSRRVGQHLSLQLTDEDVNWVDDDEKTKLATSILGVGLKKSFYDPVQGQTISEYVPAMNFVVDYYCKHIDNARRMTHVLTFDPNQIRERVRRGVFLDVEDTAANIVTETNNLLANAADEAQGIRRPTQSDEVEILEQHCWYDFDGDGYEEPYIMFVRRDTCQVRRIVARFYDEGDVYRVNDPKAHSLEAQLNSLGETSDDDMKARSQIEQDIQKLRDDPKDYIVRIDPTKYFTKYTFIPSPDGGFYGLGLGALLGPMNESVNTLVNQLIDAGTMSTAAGGFLGRGVKLKGGKTSFDPFEWKPVDSTGDDLRKNIFPLPVREPSAVLFQLLGMLVQYSEKISGATDIMTGVAPGQNTPAETSRNTVEQGMMLFSGIYARMYRSFREELKKRYELNRLYLETSPQWYGLTKGPNAILAPTDYKDNAFRIFPTADSSAVSLGQRKEKAASLMQAASAMPGFNKYVVTKMWLEANEYENIDQIFPDPSGPNAIPAPTNPKVEIEKAKLQQQQQEHKDEMQLAVAQLQAEAQVNEAKIQELQAKATKELAEADGVDTGHQIALINAQIGAAKHKQDGLMSALNLMQKAHTDQKQLEHKAKELGTKAPGKSPVLQSGASPQPAGAIGDGNNGGGQS